MAETILLQSYAPMKLLIQILTAASGGDCDDLPGQQCKPASALIPFDYTHAEDKKYAH